MSAEKSPDKTSPLLIALLTSNKNEVENLFEAGTDVNSTDGTGKTALHWVAHYEHANLDAVKLLLEHGANVDARDEKRRTPLHTAGVETAKKLLAAGADANARDIYGLTPLSLNMMGKRMDFCKFLLGHSATNVNARVHEIKEPLSRLEDSAEGRSYPGHFTYATALHVATVTNNIGGMFMLLERGANANVQDDRGQTPLMCAAICTFKELAKILIDAGADVNAADNSGATALHLARGESVASLLVQHGANIAARDTSGKTPLHYARDPRKVRTLLDAGADPNAQDVDGRTPLHVLVKAGAIAAVRMLLNHPTTELNARMKSGRTPLILAVYYIKEKIAELLLNAGADVNVVDERGHAAMHWAAASNNISTMDLLINHGANVNVKAKSGQTPLHYASTDVHTTKRLLDANADVNIQNKIGATPLHSAIVEGVTTGVIRMLLRHPTTNPNIPMYNGNTALIIAVNAMMEIVIEDLVRAGVDVDELDNHKMTALHWAAILNNVDAVRLLLKCGANPDIQDAKGQTPLYLAAFGGYAAACRILLRKFANRDIRDHEGRLPVEAANDRVHLNIVRLLNNELMPAG